MGRTNKREALLDAAEDVVLRDGPRALTLDAVGVRGEVSKGGVLYHFPTRASLVAGMVERLVDRFEEDLAAAEAADPEPRGRFLRAYLEATVGGSQRDGRLAAVLAALLDDPAVLDPWRARAGDWHRRAVADGLDPLDATVIRLAVDGLWLASLAAIPLGDEVGPIVARLVERTR